MKNIRLWATTTPEIYQKVLLLLAYSINGDGRKMKIGEFVEQAVIEKLKREEIKLKRAGKI